MTFLIADVCPRFRVLFPSATQEATRFIAHDDGVSAWIVKELEGRWRALGLEYTDENENSPLVLAALEWLGVNAGVPNSVIHNARQRVPENKDSEVCPFEGRILRVLFSPGLICVRVDRPEKLIA
ncbi:MAG: hypothetical protein H7343_11160 [Undibacterium sp.]|nr:hypothetical protein [Opitutaceae bacterium]